MRAAAPVGAALPVRQFVTAFNKGDLKAAYATFAPGEITLVDEFASHRWSGPQAPQQWVADYDKHAQATGVTEGRVTYSKPSRVEVEGSDGYVILPTVYLYKERGNPCRKRGRLRLSCTWSQAAGRCVDGRGRA